MIFFDQLNLLKRMHDFIQRKTTGKPEAFAQRLEISRTTLFRLFRTLKLLGAKIGFNTENESYYYNEPFDLRHTLSNL